MTSALHPSVTVHLRKDLTRVLRQGHPWVYRDALVVPQNIPNGTWITLLAQGSQVIAQGFWDNESPIALRILSLSPVGDPIALVKSRLTTALALRRSRLDEGKTNAFRWVHGEADRLPGLHVDRYADVASLRFDGAGSEVFYRDVAPLLMEVGDVRRVIDRGDREREKDEIEVKENDLRFWVNLGKGQKGGLFLDQRENRAQVEQLAQGKKVLNLFGYTGGFSLYATRGGAIRTDTVDIATPALENAKRNFELNGFSLDTAHFHAMDAFEFLARAQRHGKTWDLVISDPPSFAASQRHADSARRAYQRLHALAASVTSPSGILCAASCSSHFSRRDFLASVETGVHQAGRRFILRSFAGPGLDHPSLPVFPEGDYLKFAVGMVL